MLRRGMYASARLCFPTPAFLVRQYYLVLCFLSNHDHTLCPTGPLTLHLRCECFVPCWCTTAAAVSLIVVCTLLAKRQPRLPHGMLPTVLLVAYNTNVCMGCPVLPCPTPMHVPSLICKHSLSPQQDKASLVMSCVHWWNASTRGWPVAHASTCCTLFCKTTCCKHGRELLVFSLGRAAAGYTGSIMYVC